MSWTDPDGTTWTTYPWAGEGIAFDEPGDRIRIGDLVMPHAAWTLTDDEAAGFHNPDDPTSIAAIRASLLRSGTDYAADLGAHGTWIGNHLGINHTTDDSGSP